MNQAEPTSEPVSVHFIFMTTATAMSLSSRLSPVILASHSLVPQFPLPLLCSSHCLYSVLTASTETPVGSTVMYINPPPRCIGKEPTNPCLNNHINQKFRSFVQSLSSAHFVPSCPPHSFSSSLLVCTIITAAIYTSQYSRSLLIFSSFLLDSSVQFCLCLQYHDHTRYLYLETRVGTMRRFQARCQATHIWPEVSPKISYEWKY